MVNIQGDEAMAAKDAGAEIVGGEDLFSQVCGKIFYAQVHNPGIMVNIVIGSFV